MADYYNPFTSIRKFDDQQVTISRGTPSFEDEENYGLYQKNFEINAAMQFQREQEQAALALQEAIPDGRGYAAAHNGFMRERLTEIIDRSGDPQTALRLTHTLGEMMMKSSAQARDEELKIMKNNAIHTINQSQASMTEEAKKDPSNLDGYRQQAVSTTYDLGRELGWNEDEIQTEIKKFDKELVSEVLLDRLVKNPDSSEEIIGAYVGGGHFSTKEIEKLQEKAAEMADFQRDLEVLPPIGELINKSNSIINSGQDPEKLKEQGLIGDTQLAIANKLKDVEAQRESDASYKKTKDLLIKTEPAGLSVDEKDERISRLQQLYDGGELTTESINKINTETKELLKVKMDSELKQSKYLNKSIKEVDLDTLEAAKQRIGADVVSKKLNRDEARRQLRLLNRARNLL